jgi:hypothetical protein
MATTRAPQALPNIPGIEETNPAGYQHARRLGLRHDGAVLAAEHPEYLLYYRTVPPMDFRVAFASKDSINAVLTRLGYDVSHIAEPARKARATASEDIRPKMAW